MSETSKPRAEPTAPKGPTPLYRGYQTPDFDPGRATEAPNPQGGGNYNSNSYSGQGGFVGTSSYQSGGGTELHADGETKIAADPTLQPGAAVGRTPTNAVQGAEPRPDATIQTAVLAALGQHNELDASEIRVEVKDGVVTLVGTVDSATARTIAQDLSLSASGVRKVDNRLQANLGH